MSVKIADFYCHKKGSAFTVEFVCVHALMYVYQMFFCPLLWTEDSFRPHVRAHTHSYAGVAVLMKNNYIARFGRQMVEISNREGGVMVQ